MARMMDKVALIRSLHHNTGATHENGQRWMMTGPRFQRRQHQAAHRQRDLARVRAHGATCPPTSSCPGRSATPGPARLHGQTAGYLGSAHEPFFLNADPARPDFKVADLEVPAGESATRLDARKRLLEQAR